MAIASSINGIQKVVGAFSTQSKTASASVQQLSNHLSNMGGAAVVASKSGVGFIQTVANIGARLIEAEKSFKALAGTFVEFRTHAQLAARGTSLMSQGVNQLEQNYKIAIEAGLKFRRVTGEDAKQAIEMASSAMADMITAFNRPLPLKEAEDYAETMGRVRLITGQTAAELGSFAHKLTTGAHMGLQDVSKLAEGIAGVTQKFGGSSSQMFKAVMDHIEDIVDYDEDGKRLMTEKMVAASIMQEKSAAQFGKYTESLTGKRGVEGVAKAQMLAQMSGGDARKIFLDMRAAEGGDEAAKQRLTQIQLKSALGKGADTEKFRKDELALRSGTYRGSGPEMDRLIQMEQTVMARQGMTGLSVDQAVGAKSAMNRAGNETLAQEQVMAGMQNATTKGMNEQLFRTIGEAFESGKSIVEKGAYELGQALFDKAGPQFVDTLTIAAGAAEKFGEKLAALGGILDLLNASTGGMLGSAIGGAAKGVGGFLAKGASRLFGGGGGAGGASWLTGGASKLLGRAGLAAIVGKGVWNMATESGRAETRADAAADENRNFLERTGHNMLRADLAISKLGVGGYDTWKASSDAAASVQQANQAVAVGQANVQNSKQFVSDMAKRGLFVIGKYKNLGIDGAIRAGKTVPINDMNRFTSIGMNRAKAIGKNTTRNAVELAIYSAITEGKSPFFYIEQWEKAAGVVMKDGANTHMVDTVKAAMGGDEAAKREVAQIGHYDPKNLVTTPEIRGAWQDAPGAESQIKQLAQTGGGGAPSSTGPSSTGPSMFDIHTTLNRIADLIEKNGLKPETLGMS